MYLNIPLHVFTILYQLYYLLTDCLLTIDFYHDDYRDLFVSITCSACANSQPPAGQVQAPTWFSFRVMWGLQCYVTFPSLCIFPPPRPPPLLTQITSEAPPSPLQEHTVILQRGFLKYLHHDLSSNFWVYRLYQLAVAWVCGAAFNRCGQKLEATQLSTWTFGRAFSGKCLHGSWLQISGEGEVNTLFPKCRVEKSRGDCLYPRGHLAYKKTTNTQ